MDLSDTRIAVAPLSGDIMMIRTGKDPGLALDKREAGAEVLMAVAQHMMHDMPGGATKEFWYDGTGYKLTVEPITNDTRAIDAWKQAVSELDSHWTFAGTANESITQSVKRRVAELLTPNVGDKPTNEVSSA